MKILLSEVWLGEQGIQRIRVCGESPTVLTQKALEGEKAIVNKTHLNGPSQLLCSSDLHLTPLGSPASNTNGCCWCKTVWSRVSLCHNASIPRTLAGNKGGDSRVGNEDFDSCSQAHASVAPGVWNPSHSKSVPKVVCRLEDLALNLLTVWSCIFSLSQVTLLPSNPAPGLDFSELFQIPEHSRLEGVVSTGILVLNWPVILIRHVIASKTDTNYQISFKRLSEHVKSMNWTT